MDESPQIDSPTEQDLLASLAVLRKLSEPFGSSALRMQTPLQQLPFLRDIASADERLAHLKAALVLIADDLTADQLSVYRHVFLEPAHQRLGKRQQDAADEINARRTFDREIHSSAARSREKTLMRRVAALLLDADFAELLDEHHPVTREAVAPAPPFPGDAYEMLRYEWDFDIDEEDPRTHTDRRVMKLRMSLPHQRVFGLNFYNYRLPHTPTSVVLDDPEQTYLDSLPDRAEGMPGDWWMHFFHLGRLKPPGEEIEVSTCERYFDEGEGESKPHVAITVRFASLEVIRAGVRVPARFLDQVRGEALIVRDPYNTRQPLERWDIVPDADGWVREEFTDLELGLQYGVYLRDINLYRRRLS
jgi:hypothetical protein